MENIFNNRVVYRIITSQVIVSVHKPVNNLLVNCGLFGDMWFMGFFAEG